MENKIKRILKILIILLITISSLEISVFAFEEIDTSDVTTDNGTYIKGYRYTKTDGDDNLWVGFYAKDKYGNNPIEVTKFLEKSGVSAKHTQYSLRVKYLGKYFVNADAEAGRW